GQFKEVHNLFKKYIILHTVALICKGIERNKELINFINHNDIDVQIHCWEHYRFNENKNILAADLKKSVKNVTKYFNNPPTVVYPPWNEADDEVMKICADMGLQCNPVKVSLQQFIRFGGNPGCDVVNFHSWAYDDIISLEPALKIYSQNR
ncbi:MAG TPA: polysaccharide deacetylase family protein, partial [Candidatus Babeliaceae bacterium]|nr:polysaccharide deacetylase family protein [Candidatus Babeliaceae bacterium]